MAAGCITKTGIELDVRYNDVDKIVEFRYNISNEWGEAFSLDDESPLSVYVDNNNRWIIVYQDSEGNVLRQFSTDKGVTWNAQSQS